MYSKSAHYYDLVYKTLKNYEDEARQIKELILQYNPEAKKILDVACGSGEHHRHLKGDFKITGLDLNIEFVTIAQEKNPECHYEHQDMRAFEINNRFDAIICMFSSIGYLKSEEEVRKTLKCFKEHLAQDGVIIVEPWFTPSSWHTPHIHMMTAEAEGLKICRASSSQSEGRTSRADMHYLIATNEGVEYFSEEHALTLFTVEEMKSAFESVGLRVKHQADGIIGRGLYVAQLYSY